MTSIQLKAQATPPSNGLGRIIKLLIVLAMFGAYEYFAVHTSPEVTRVAKSAADPPSTTCLDLQIDEDVKNRYRPTMQEHTKCLLYQEPSMYIKLVLNQVLGAPNHGRCDMERGCKKHHLPYDAELRYYGNDWPPFGYTMIGRARLENLRAAIEEVNRNHIPGAIVELGVWRGGAMITAAAMGEEPGTTRRDVYLFDAFDAIPGYGGSVDFLENSIDDVRGNFEQFNLLMDNVHFEKGFFKDSLPKWKDRKDPIAVLRVDANFYDSYQDAMYYLYENVPVGGIVIFDDVMTHKPVMRFWLDFKREQGLPEELNRIDTHSAWFRKEKEIQLDFSKMHAPQDANIVK